MKYTYIFISLLIFTLLLYCCDNKKVVAPPTNTKPENLHWEVDTLEFPDILQISMRTMWTENSENVYIGGHSSGGLGHESFHWDGQSWQRTTLSFRRGGPIIGGFNVEEIFGLDATHIWAVGDVRVYDDPDIRYRGFLAFFNGNEWQKNEAVSDKIRLMDVWADATDNVWVVGDSGTYFHYDGQDWTEGEFEHNSHRFIAVGGTRDQLFATGWQIGSSATKWREHYVCYKFINREWKLISEYYSGEHPQFGISQIHASPEGTIYSVDGGIFKWEQDAWQLLLQPPESIINIYAVSDDYIWAVGNFGAIYFYDGAAWEKIPLPEGVPADAIFGGVWSNGKKTYLMCRGIYENWKTVTYVLRGE